MYGSYSRFATQQANESVRKAVDSVIATRAAELVNAIRRNGGRLTHAQVVAQFGADALERAVEIDRTVHPESSDVNGKIITWYIAN